MVKRLLSRIVPTERQLELKQLGLSTTLKKITTRVIRTKKLRSFGSICDISYSQSLASMKALKQTFELHLTLPRETFYDYHWRVMSEYAEFYLADKYYSQTVPSKILLERQPQPLTGRGFQNALINDYRAECDLRPYWDRARGYHLISLYSRYKLTKRTIFHEKLEAELSLFSSRTDFCRTYIWTDALNLAIRSLNLLALIEILQNDNSYLLERAIVAYDMTCRALILTRSPATSIENNHHLVETLSLLLYYVIKANSEMWNKELTYLTNLRGNLFYPNGLLYEGTLPYQRFALEAYLVILFFLRKLRVDQDLIKKIFLQIELIYQFAVCISGPSHEIKKFGDYDYGQIIRRSLRNYDYLTEIINLYRVCKSPDVLSNHSLITSYFSDSSTNFNISDNIKLTENFISNIGFSRFSRFAFEIWIDNDYPGLGRNGVGGHGHNDTSSIIVNYNDEEIISDFGVEGYFKGNVIRNADRSSHNHNIVSRNDFEQSELVGNYYINSKIDKIHTSFTELETSSIFKIMYRNKYHDGDVYHRRIIKVQNKKLIIYDIACSVVEMNFCSNFLFKGIVTLDNASEAKSDKLCITAKEKLISNLVEREKYKCGEVFTKISSYCAIKKLFGRYVAVNMFIVKIR